MSTTKYVRDLNAGDILQLPTEPLTVTSVSLDPDRPNSRMITLGGTVISLDPHLEVTLADTTTRAQDFVVWRDGSIDGASIDNHVITFDMDALSTETRWEHERREIMGLLTSMVRHPRREQLRPWIHEIVDYIGNHANNDADIEQARKLLAEKD